jgi:hypothetical protein
VETTLHQDPRYFRSCSTGFWRRAGHALRGTILTRTDRGGETLSTWRIGRPHIRRCLSFKPVVSGLAEYRVWVSRRDRFGSDSISPPTSVPSSVRMSNGRYYAENREVEHVSSHRAARD